MSEGRMTAEQTPDIADQLIDLKVPNPLASGPENDIELSGIYDWIELQRFAQALAPVLAAAVREARAAGLREAAAAAVSDSDDCVPWDQDHDRATVACWLEDRADRIDVDAPEGGA